MNDFGYGQMGMDDTSSEFAAISFIVRQMIARMETMKLVRVESVHSNGAIAAAGTVDVLPLVSQVDGNGYAVPHGTVYGISWWRLQGGACAVVCDPVVGDIGYVDVSDRDISNVKKKKAPATPGSFRRFDLADGIYVGGCLNAAPTSYVAFGADGSITISPDNGVTFIKIEAGKITIQAAEIIGHATIKNVWDAGGTGFVYTPSTIDSYTTGATSTSHPIHPPEVPT